ncbi:MAG: bifunctional pyr operon transcriptional regulator/uracil phosphoribosyltransferase PyrR [Immundisolibacteraceae bacterium]|nr:bifunctional pyr operon transcriptional regulator/uracil phosphoribosyltransferase PyrR [Immundisolibacteraceae bacterium]
MINNGSKIAKGGSQRRVKLGPTAISKLLDQMATECQSLLAGKQPLVVGIHTGGVWVAQELAKRLQSSCAEVDISFHRDDILKRGLPRQTAVTQLPVSLTGRTVVLVDDVLHTGRTIRAALEELYDRGRPAQVLLAVLVDRGGHELPIRADVVGQQLDLVGGDQVKLSGPKPLKIEVHHSGDE